ncbi:MAG: glycosyl transferase family 8, partial [Desulfovibrio sp.]|nr:glycosyl transferase family 8 [Desulfovibrio sp.]
QPVADLDPDSPNLNSGVWVLDGRLRAIADAFPEKVFHFLEENAASLRYPDQAALNMLAQGILCTHPSYFRELPTSFNCHPKNAESLFAPLVHAFGAYKLWNDGLTQACFPEWQRDYKRWVKAGGSAWKGIVENAEYAKISPFVVLSKLYGTLQKSEQTLLLLSEQVKKEKEARSRLEKLIARFSS